MNQLTVKPTIGDCEAGLKGCLGDNTEVWKMHGNILMCAVCREQENLIVRQTAAAKQLLDASRQIDSNIQIKQDVFLAQTVPAIELRGAINANREIPDNEKEYTYAKECMTRYLHMKKVVSAMRADLIEKENEMRMWQVNVQDAAGKLRSELRDQFKELDVNYQPTPIKPVKSFKSPKKKMDKAALYEAAKKYGVPAAGLQALMGSRPNKTYDEVALELAKMMGLK